MSGSGKLCHTPCMLSVWPCAIALLLPAPPGKPNLPAEASGVTATTSLHLPADEERGSDVLVIERRRGSVGGSSSEGEGGSEAAGSEEEEASDEEEEEEEEQAWSGSESEDEEDVYRLLNRAASSTFSRQVCFGGAHQWKHQRFGREWGLCGLRRGAGIHAYLTKLTNTLDPVLRWKLAHPSSPLPPCPLLHTALPIAAAAVPPAARLGASGHAARAGIRAQVRYAVLCCTLGGSRGDPCSLLHFRENGSGWTA